jgi:hypothetical protein
MEAVKVEGPSGLRISLELSNQIKIVITVNPPSVDRRDSCRPGGAPAISRTQSGSALPTGIAVAVRRDGPV